MIGYGANPADEPLSLYEGAFDLCGSKERVSTRGSISVIWFPRPWLVFRISAEEPEPLKPAMLLVFDDQESIRIEDPSGTFRCERDGSFGATF